MLHLSAVKIHTARRRAADLLAIATAITAQPDPHQKCESREPPPTALKKARIGMMQKDWISKGLSRS